ncbi:MAG TPA: hypothetical protein VJS44_04750 [Pyrinomonadaceae bacterium]|nr:hypothetical protein [Pyrinomonadaceae bacterium]
MLAVCLLIGLLSFTAQAGNTDNPSVTGNTDNPSATVPGNTDNPSADGNTDNPSVVWVVIDGLLVFLIG